MTRALVLCALAACTYPEKQFDGPFTCLGAPPPTTAKMLVNIHGQVVDGSNLAPIGGATLTLQGVQMVTISTTTTDSAGNFSFMFNTNGTPADGLDIYATASGRVDTYFYPPHPVTDDYETELVLVSTAQAMALAAGAGVQFDASHGAALPTIQDCNGAALAGAVVTASPSGTARYFDGVQPSMTATSTDAGGVALIAQLPVGAATLSTTVQSNKLPDRHFTIVANTFIQTFIQP